MKNEELISKLMVESMVLAPFSDVGRFDAIKFAELIVRECEVALNPPVQVRNIISRGQAYDLIREHFGVE